MGRKYSGSKVYDRSPDEVWAVISGVAAQAAFKETASDATAMTFRAKKSLKDVDVASLGRRSAQKTWGENLEVQVRADGERTRVDAESKLKFGLIDWGANRDNVERFLGALDAELN